MDGSAFNGMAKALNGIIVWAIIGMCLSAIFTTVGIGFLIYELITHLSLMWS